MCYFLKVETSRAYYIHIVSVYMQYNIIKLVLLVFGHKHIWFIYSVVCLYACFLAFGFSFLLYLFFSVFVFPFAYQNTSGNRYVSAFWSCTTQSYSLVFMHRLNLWWIWNVRAVLIQSRIHCRLLMVRNLKKVMLLFVELYPKYFTSAV